MSDEFYILSLKWSVDQNGKPLPRRKSGWQPGDQFVLIWWAPDAKGYTRCLENAGRYTRAQIDAAPGYYNNGETTCAVPCEVVEAHANRMTGDWHMHTFRTASGRAFASTDEQETA